MKKLLALTAFALTIITSGCHQRTPQEKIMIAQQKAEKKLAAKEARECVNPAPWEVRGAAIVHYTDEEGYHSRVVHAPQGGNTRTTPQAMQYNDGNP